MHFCFKIFASIAVLFCVFFSVPSLAMPSFDSAKRAIKPIYYELNQILGETKTIYCGCPIKYDNKKNWSINSANCGYKVRKNKQRANRIEVEHVMAAWEFGHQMKCWQNGGRDNCGKDKQFKKMEGDLHNLYPSIGEVNGDRGNFQFSDWGAKPGMYGKCEMVVDFSLDLAQPPKASRGQIARAYLYMSQKYGIKLSNQQRRLYEAWDRQYAPDQFECLRNELIAQKQGNDNPFITAKCSAQGKHASNTAKNQEDGSEESSLLYKMLENFKS